MEKQYSKTVSRTEVHAQKRVLRVERTFMDPDERSERRLYNAFFQRHCDRRS